MNNMTYRFDIKTVSEANQREHWATRNRRKKRQQADFSVLWRSMGCTVTPPATVTFTRYSCRTLDSDNITSCFKGIRDALAREIDIDDGDDRVTYRYEQERIRTRENYFTVTVENR